jgi:hypothetical protein
MASALVWKVYGTAGEHVASLRYAEDAALIVGNTPDGVVKVDGRIVWREGHEQVTACDNVDLAADWMGRRRRVHYAQHYNLGSHPEVHHVSD